MLADKFISVVPQDLLGKHSLYIQIRTSCWGTSLLHLSEVTGDFPRDALFYILCSDQQVPALKLFFF